MPRLTKLRTMLVTNDLDGTIAFYERLGFECIGTFPDEEPTWAQVARDDVMLMWNHSDPEPHDHGDGDVHAHVPEMSGSIYINVDDVDAYFAEVRPKLDAILFDPADQPHGMREFALHDNNGYVLLFGAPTA